MKNCIHCNVVLNDQIKFCNDCGTKQPEKTTDDPSGLIGDKNVISTGGGDITGTKITGGTVSYNTVNEAQDDTKKRVRCYYTNQGVALEDIIKCHSCNKEVAKSYFNNKNNRCHHCDVQAKEEYAALVIDFLEDGRLSSDELQILKINQKRLLLTDDETLQIEQVEKEHIAYIKSSELSTKDLKDIEDLANIFELNKHIRQADSIVKILFKKYEKIPDVSFFYYLNQLDINNEDIYKNMLTSREDNLFGYFFGGLSSILNSKLENSEAFIEKISVTYDEFYYFNDALKALLLADKFEYQRNDLIFNKLNLLIKNITTENIKEIYLSAYLGVLRYVDNYSCNGEFANEITKHSDSIATAFGYFLINRRENELKAIKRKLDAEKQAEQEKIALDILYKKTADEKARNEAFRIEEEKKLKLENQLKIEKAKKEQEKHIEKKKKQEDRSKTFNGILNWFLEKDEKGESSKLWITGCIIGISLLLYFWIIPTFNKVDSDKEQDQRISVELEKEYEKINSLITYGKIDSAQGLLINLVHPSIEESPHKPEGVLAFPYSYTEYWNIKREELRKKIEDKISKGSPENVSNEKISEDKLNPLDQNYNGTYKSDAAGYIIKITNHKQGELTFEIIGQDYPCTGSVKENAGMGYWDDLSENEFYFSTGKGDGSDIDTEDELFLTFNANGTLTVRPGERGGFYYEGNCAVFGEETLKKVIPKKQKK